LEQTQAILLSGSSLPPRLFDLPDPPGALYVHGELPRGPAVALVGTRRPTSEAVSFCRELAGELARAGVAVFSGGAEGIDSSAHEGALAVGGSTVVVAPSSLDRPFPSDNAALFRRVVDAGGAHVSLWPDGTAATQPAFFARNACLVGLCHALVVVEAPFRSGARNAARWARTLGRPLFAVPSAPWNERGRGCLLELRAGAKLCEGASDILEALALQLLSPVPLPSGVVEDTEAEQVELPFIDPKLSPDERVLAAVRSGARHVDHVSVLSGLSLARTQESILTLTVKGVLAPDAGGRIVEGALSKRTQSRRRIRK
jgi:DNA processing protein